MFPDIDLAGFRLTWAFRGSRSFRTWISAVPWDESGGLRVLSVTDRSLAASFFEWIQREVAALPSALEARILQSPSPSPCPLTDILEGVGAEVPESEFKRIEAVAELCSDAPIVFVPTLGVDAHRYLEDLQFIHEIVQKRPGLPLTTIALDPTPGLTFPGAVVDNFRSGYPVDGPEEALPGRGATSWRSYLHLRIAWETGGNIALAGKWSDSGIDLLKTGDDEELERRFNDLAIAEFDAIQDRALKAAFLEHCESALKGSARSNEQSGFARLQLVWKPPAELRWRPTPWAARAMLARHRSSKARYWLRRSLVCAPLSCLILSRCLDLEAALKTVHWSQDIELELPEKSHSMLEMFRASRPGTGAKYYPKAHPSPPASAWSFSPLGQVAHSTDQFKDSSIKAILYLRNHLAHGGYVSWAAVTTLAEIEHVLGVA